MSETQGTPAVETKEEQSGKIAKNYQSTMKKLIAIVGGEKNLFPVKKASKDVIATIVTGLVKDQKEEIEKEVKKELRDILDKHIELKKNIAIEEKKFQQLKEQKTKEFTEAAAKVFTKIDSIDSLEKDYYDSITSATQS